MSGSTHDQAPLVFVADLDRQASRQTLEEAVGIDLYARAVHARVLMKVRYVAVILGPTGRAVVPLIGPVELLDFRRVLADLTAVCGLFDYVPLELDDETARELCGDLALRTLGTQEPEGHG